MVSMVREVPKPEAGRNVSVMFADRQRFQEPFRLFASCHAIS